MGRFRLSALALTLPAFLYMAALYFYPVAQVMAVSVTEPTPGFGNYQNLVESAAIGRMLDTTMSVSLTTSAITVVAAYIVAFLLVTMGPRARRIALFLVIVPFWISVLVRAFGWMTILQRQGLLNTALIKLGLTSTPLELMYNRTGVIIGMVHYMMPFAVLLLYANLQGIDARLIQAAKSLGARPATIFARVWFPLSLPGVAVASLFVLIFSLGFLVTPALLGGGRTVMVAEYVSVQITNTLRWGVATSLSTALFILVGIVVFITFRTPALRAAFEARTPT